MEVIARRRFVRSRLTPAEAVEVARVDDLATRLADHLEEREADIAVAHVHGAQSKAIQSIVERILCDELAFRSEVVLTPQDGFVTQARPDFVFTLGDGRGVIAEVERGGTVNNNHDLKDMWKVHIARDAQHLLLVVPQSNWKADGSARERPFARVVHRLSSFFGDPRRELDVLSCHVLGYGGLTTGGAGAVPVDGAPI